MHKVAPQNQQGQKVVQNFRDASGQPCRVVNETVLIDGEKAPATGTVCKRSDGRWAIAAADADIATEPSLRGVVDADAVSAKGQPTPLVDDGAAAIRSDDRVAHWLKYLADAFQAAAERAGDAWSADDSLE
jgi:hypothetical protein